MEGFHSRGFEGNMNYQAMC